MKLASPLVKSTIAGRSGGTQTIPSEKPADPIPKAALNRSRWTSVRSAVSSTSSITADGSGPPNRKGSRPPTLASPSTSRVHHCAIPSGVEGVIANRPPRLNLLE